MADPRNTEKAESIDINHVLNHITASSPKEFNTVNRSQIDPEARALNFTLTEDRSNQVLHELTKIQTTTYPCALPSYDPKKCPPDLSKAEKHGLAHEIYAFDPQRAPSEHCESTGIPVSDTRLGLCAPLRKLSHLGPVIPMYFLLAKQITFVVFLLSCVGLAILLPNTKDFSQIDYQNIVSSIVENEKQCLLLISLITVALVLIFFLAYFFRRSQKMLKLSCKKGLITPSDYTVMVSNMGKIYTHEEVKAFFSNYIVPGYSLDVQKVAETQDIERYIDVIRQLKFLIKSKAEAEKVANYISSGVVEEIQQKISQINDFFSQNKKVFPGARGLKRNGLCFVSYSTKQEAKTVRRKFDFSVVERSLIWLLERCTDEFPEYFFKDCHIAVEKAPELNEIIWENLNCNTSRKQKGLFYLLIYLVTLSATFVSAYYIKNFKKIPSDIKIYMIAAIVFIVNEFLAAIVQILSRYIHFKTITQLYIWIQKATILLQFINISGAIIILHFYSPDTEVNYAWEILIISIFTSIIPLICRMINFAYIRKNSLKNKIINLVQGSSNSNGITQEEANHAFEKPEFNLHQVYIDTIRTLLVTCLFFAISPGIAFVAFISLLIGYFVDKYNLLRKSAMPTALRSEIAEAMFEFIDFAAFLLAAGGYLLIQLTEESSTHEVSYTISVFTIIAASLYFILPNRRFARSCFKIKKGVPWSQLLLFQQASEYFSIDYQSANPVCTESSDLKAVKETHKNIQNEFKVIDALSEVPELLTLFNYTKKTLSVSEIKSQGLEGLKNPFYSFPQNYRFGINETDIVNSQHQILQVPLISDQYLKENHHIIPKSKNHDIIPTSLELANSSETRGKFMIRDQSMKGNSIMKDIMLIPSYNGKKNTEFVFKEVDDYEQNQSPVFGGLIQHEQEHEDHHSINTFNSGHFGNGLTPLSHNEIGMLEGVSPISGFSMNKK